MSSFGSFIRGLDRYGQPVTVNYQGEDTYKTKTGGILTILVYALVATYTVLKANQLVLRDNPNVTSTTEFVNYETDTTTYNLEQNNLEAVIRFEMLQPNGETWSWENLDERFGRFVAY